MDITKEEAAAAVRRAARHYDDPDHPDHGRTLIHSFRSFIGADWDLDAALHSISKAQRCAWVNHLLGHDLGVVEADGRVVYFDCTRPDREAS